VFTSDPADDGGDDRELIARVGAAELLAMDVPTLPIDALVLELMADAKHVKEIQIVNGLTPGNITRALGGEHVGRSSTPTDRDQRHGRRLQRENGGVGRKHSPRSPQAPAVAAGARCQVAIRGRLESNVRTTRRRARRARSGARHPAGPRTRVPPCGSCR